MARPIRVEFPEALYHVMARGNGKGTVFETDGDRSFFLSLLARVWDRHRLEVHAYCLMSNHYHLLARTPLGNLGRAIQHLNGMYAQWFSRNRDRPGHVWGGRYKAKLVEGEEYFLAASRYIVLNPVEVGLAATAADWRWSSFRATVGETRCPRFFNRGFTLRILDPRADRASEIYRQIAGVRPIGPMPDPRVLATPEFLHRLDRLVRERTHSEAAILERRPARPSLGEWLPLGLPRPERDARLREGFEAHGYSMREMAEALRVHPSTVSRIVHHGVRSEKRGRARI